MKVGVSGHQNIPPNVAAYVRERIADRLSAVTDLVGISSLAAGADQLFAEAVLAAGGRLEAIVPCRGYESTFEQSEDLDRYQHLLRAASAVTTLDFPGPSEEAFLAAGKRVAESADELFAVWDGEPSKGLGGTADIVAFARSSGTPVVVIWLAGAAR